MPCFCFAETFKFNEDSTSAKSFYSNAVLVISMIRSFDFSGPEQGCLLNFLRFSRLNFTISVFKASGCKISLTTLSVYSL